MEQESCGNCRFYIADECRRYAPIPLIGSEEKAQWSDVNWVAVNCDEWCGEWKPVYKEQPQ
jgi:hypothetical protein